MADDLFSAAAAERLAAQAPLADRLRPRKLDDVVGQDQLLGPGAPLRALIETDRLSSVVLWGPPGTGKTTIARLIADTTAKEFVPMSAVSASVKDVRETMAAAHRRLGEQGEGTILFLDEVHRFNKAQQDALLPAVESGLLVLIGATTENPYFEVNPPLRSRSTIFRLEPLAEDAVRELIRRGLEAEGATIDEDAVAHIVPRVGGDGRQALTTLEVAIALAAARGDAAQRPGGAANGARSGAEGRAGEAEGRVAPFHVVLADAEAALGTKALRYGRDEHFDVISAFIKSLRGSDVDAGLYWLSSMVEAGEDPRYIARRMVVLASEDIGMADPMALVVANAAAHAVEYVGLPEAAINLAHAVIYLAQAPKSNRVIVALGRAGEDVRSGRGGEVPMHLRDASYRGAAKLGHGRGYEYPHDDPRGWVPQEYRPPGVAGRRYYEPSDHGAEQEVATRMARMREREEDE